MNRLLLALSILLAQLSVYAQSVNVSASNLQLKSSARILDGVAQADGKVIVVGDFVSFNGTAAKNIVRVNSDGSADNTFAIGTGPDNAPYINEITNVKMMSDGKVLLRGQFSKFNGVSRYRLVRLNADGSVDTGFVPATNTADVSYAFTNPLAANATSVYYSYYNSTTTRYHVARLNSDGSANTAFSSGTGFNGFVSDLELQPDGKLLVAGYFTNYNSQTVKNLIRLNTDGSLDAEFTVTSPLHVAYSSVNNKIAVSCYESVYIFNQDGTPDNTYTVNGLKSNVSAATWISATDFIIGDGFGRVRKVAPGANATIYSPSGASFGDIITRVIAQPDGKVHAFGTPESLNKLAYRVNADFTLDNTFNSGIGATMRGVVHCATVQPDGKLIIAGIFNSVRGIVKTGIVRLNNDFTVDNTFAGSGLGPNARNYIHSMAIQADGKIVVASSSTTYNGTSISGFIRLNTDGTIDNTFTAPSIGSFDNVPTGSTTGSEAMVRIAPNGSVLLAGRFGSFGNDFSTKYIVRLTANGIVDATFKPVLNKEVLAIGVQGDGKLVIAGKFTSLNGSLVPKVIRLNADGTLDATFLSKATLTSDPKQIQILPNGRILLSTFTDGCVRLLPNGDIDTSFTKVPGTTSGPFMMKDGTLLVGTSTIQRSNSSGIIDTDFALTTNVNIADQLTDVVHVDPNNIVIVGTFLNKVNTTDVENFAVVTYSLYPEMPGAPTNLKLTSSSGYPTVSWTDNATTEESFEIERAENTATTFVRIGNPIKDATTYTDATAKDHMQYFYRVRAKNKSGVSDYSNQLSVATVITGLEDSEPAWSVSPNPAKESITVRKNSSSEIPVQIAIVDLLGRTFIRQSSSSSETTISIESLPAGIYFVKMMQSNTRVVRLIKN